MYVKHEFSTGKTFVSAATSSVMQKTKKRFSQDSVPCGFTHQSITHSYNSEMSEVKCFIIIDTCMCCIISRFVGIISK